MAGLLFGQHFTILLRESKMTTIDIKIKIKQANTFTTIFNFLKLDLMLSEVVIVIVVISSSREGTVFSVVRNPEKKFFFLI